VRSEPEAEVEELGPQKGHTCDDAVSDYLCGYVLAMGVGPERRCGTVFQSQLFHPHVFHPQLHRTTSPSPVQRFSGKREPAAQNSGPGDACRTRRNASLVVAGVQSSAG
jgi:hypothetical protein